MRHDLQAGFILHSRPYRESSLIVEVFTEKSGRSGLVARGARRPKSRLRGVLRPFQALHLSWVGRGELGTVTVAEPAQAPYLTGGKILASGFYLNELLLRLLARNDPHEALYRAYRETLARLASGAGSPEPALRVFEKRLLQELGYGLLLNREAGDGPQIRPEQAYRYKLESGPVAVDTAAGDGLVLHGESLLALAREELSGTRVLREIKALNRAALNQYLGGKPLRSREMWRS